MTSPVDSLHYARRARAVAADLEFVEVPGGTHAMVRSMSTWNRLAVGGVLDGLQLR